MNISYIKACLGENVSENAQVFLFIYCGVVVVVVVVGIAHQNVKTGQLVILSIRHKYAVFNICWRQMVERFIYNYMLATYDKFSLVVYE